MLKVLCCLLLGLAPDAADALLARSRVPLVTDWSGRLLNKRVLRVLERGDTVRVQIEGRDKLDGYGTAAAFYFRIVKKKDGMFWGEALNLYGNFDHDGLASRIPFTDLKEGDIFPFWPHNIVEVPIMWQARSRRKKMRPFLMNKARFFTGPIEPCNGYAPHLCHDA
eukprot:CAMPEP_0119090664 /NCGR_PEP_ID=MMETSP1178-20130426/153589_1 /TAXON_ID=33656 /ORGANISM="unid sp, Strain CCMP2000" /LENGTH=165 /DNA_ID=CAMNT_0007074111 /DNA_START=44 /DNA_END=541 /DNA_ORIENTATION=+